MTTEESARFVRGARGAVDDDVLDQLDADVRRLAAEYVSRPPITLFRPLSELRHEVFEMLDHRQHPAVELLTDLYRGSAYPVFETLKKEKILTPEDLFALGFSLVERHGQERGLGVDLLEHIAAKFPRNKVGKSAKNKLKLASG